MFVEEMAPRKISGSLGVLNQFMAVFSILFLTALAFILPYPSEPFSHQESSWRIVFGFPGLTGLLQLFLLVFVYQFETPEFYKISHQKELYEQIMGKIYVNYDPDHWIESVEIPLLSPEEKSKKGKKSKEPKFRDLFSNNHRYAMFI